MNPYAGLATEHPAAENGQMENRPPTLIEDLRELLAQTRERQESERGVMDGVGELIGTLREDMAKSVEMRDAFCGSTSSSAYKFAITEANGNVLT